MSFKDELKGLIISQGFSLSQINDELNRLHNTNYSSQNFSNKLRRESFSYCEVVEILSIIGMKIKIVKEENDLQNQ